MLISCPECRYEKEMESSKVNFRSATATCPSCGHRFVFSVPGPEAPQFGLEPIDAPKAQAKAPADPPRPVAAEPAATAAEPKQEKVVPLAAVKQKPKTPSTHSISFEGKGLPLLRLYVVSNFLSVLTLGVYHFWGKAKIRKYLYSSTELMGERFSFTGTGKELFFGWLKAALIMALLFSAPNALSTFVHPAFGLIAVPIMFVVFPAVMVGSWRYRLSRTSWHGASFSFTGKTKDYMLLHIKGSLLTLLTFGLYAPYFHAQKESFWRKNSNYGTTAFGYDGKAEDIRKDFLKAWLLTVPTLGFVWFWYAAKVARYDWEHTSFSGVRFSFGATGRQYFAFLAGNLALLAFTLGLAYPWVVVRGVKFISKHLAMKGDVEFNKINHAPQRSKAVGEGLASVLDIDMAM